MENESSALQGVLKLAQQENVRFVRLQFTDLLGSLKNVEISIHQLEQALTNGVAFDGSSIDGYARIEESDMTLVPDLTTWLVLPWTTNQGRVARLICDVRLQEDIAFAGDPRRILKNTLNTLSTSGISGVRVGMECEFFLLPLDENGYPDLVPKNNHRHFDNITPNNGSDCRREIVQTLRKMGVEINAAHPEAVAGQHEIDFADIDALAAADNFMTFKMIAKTIATKHGFYASFMPKPFAAADGSGLHFTLSLELEEVNTSVQYSNGADISETVGQYVAGLLQHAQATTAITNPTINSYKRIVPGYGAPIATTWSRNNPNAYIRIPATRDSRIKIEVRSPDSACNPYLALSVLLQSGLDGIQSRMRLPASFDTSISTLSSLQLLQHGISYLPRNLEDAISALEEDVVVQGVLGDHAYYLYHRAKLEEWTEYQKVVHPWEHHRYLHQI